MINNKRLYSFILLFVFMAAQASPLESMAAVKTPMASLSKKTNTEQYTVTVNSAKGTRAYQVFAQKTAYPKKKSYISLHGCAVSALTTVLSGYPEYAGKYSGWTPDKISKKVEKKVLGTKVWKSNYKKPLSTQMPLSLYGVSKILKYCGIKNKYVRFFKDKKALKEIKSNLKAGRPVMIEVNNHKQKNGVISKAYTNRWASSKHTMVLLGLTDTGKVIVADSAYRQWSGEKQRVKFTTLEHLIQYMIPCKAASRQCYYTSVNVNGGYILVNK